MPVGELQEGLHLCAGLPVDRAASALAIYSGELGTDGADRVNLAMITRAAMTPFYRSDSMSLDRLHWEPALDRSSKDVAADLRQYVLSANAPP